MDWRLFENPFVNLSDIFVPVAEFAEFEQVFEQLPDLTEALSENVTGGEDEARKTPHTGGMGGIRRTPRRGASRRRGTIR